MAEIACFLVALRMIWEDWKSALVIVQPETVVSWHRNRFKRYWRQLSRPKMPGRPPVTGEIRKLVRTMASANPSTIIAREHIWRCRRTRPSSARCTIVLREESFRSEKSADSIIATIAWRPDIGFEESIPFPIHDSLKRSGLSFTYSAFAEPIMAY
jgi:hypothetical protein